MSWTSICWMAAAVAMDSVTAFAIAISSPMLAYSHAFLYSL